MLKMENNRQSMRIRQSGATQIRPPPWLSFRSFDLGFFGNPKPDFTFKATVNFENSRVFNLHFVYQITYQSQNDS